MFYRPFLVRRDYIITTGEVVQNDPPEVDGLTITLGSDVDTGGNDTQVFRFPFRYLVVPKAASSVWSEDGLGDDWLESSPGPRLLTGPMNSSYKQALCVGGDEILNIAANAHGNGIDGFTVGGQRSLDDWVTKADEDIVLDTPSYVPLVTDGGGSEDGPIFHHRIGHRRDGGQMGLIYGCTAAEIELMSGYPRAYGALKFRLEAVFSEIGNKGASWGNPVPIFSAARGMLTRGINPDSGVFDPAVCDWETQEGAAEGDWTERANGHYWAFCRTGGRQAGSATVGTLPIYPTPPMMAISTDQGLTWDRPRQIPTSPLYAFRHANNPVAVTLGNGVTILTYGGPGGGYMAFAKPGVEPLFEGFYQLTQSDAYTDMVPIAYNKALVFYFSGGTVHCRGVTVDVDGEAGLALIKAALEPWKILSGQESRVTWFGTAAVDNVKIFGGVWENGGAGTVAARTSSVHTGVLTADTTYRLEFELGSNPGFPAPASPVEVTVDVQ